MQRLALPNIPVAAQEPFKLEREPGSAPHRRRARCEGDEDVDVAVEAEVIVGNAPEGRQLDES